MNIHAGPKRISSRWTFFYKRVFPTAWFGFLGIFLLLSAFSSNHGGPGGIFLAVPVVMTVFGYFLMRVLVFDLVDEVFDGGEFLLIRNGGTESRLQLSDVMTISYTWITNPPRVTLSVRDNMGGSKKVTFSPPHVWRPFARHPMIDDLIRRVDHARSQ